MAQAKSMSRAKVSTKAKTEVVEQVEEAVKEKPVVEKVVKKEPRKFEAMDGILCRSITDGFLIMEGIKSHNVYLWENTHDEIEVEYQDLISAVRSNKSYVFAPYFIIEDEDFLEAFPQVQKVYDTMYTTSDLRDILKVDSVSTMINAIKTLPKESQFNVKDMAGKMILDGTMDSVKKIKALDEYFGTNFMITTNLFG